jgi:hypothetical protein
MIGPFKGTHSTNLRRNFWNKVHAAVKAVQKIQGAEIEIDHRPEGSVIHATPRAGKDTGGGATGACCIFNPETLIFDCSQQTQANCTSAGGTFLGAGVPCTGDPCNEMVACCGCLGCFDTEWASCINNGGYPQGIDSECADYADTYHDIATCLSSITVTVAMSGELFSYGSCTIIGDGGPEPAEFTARLTFNGECSQTRTRSNDLTPGPDEFLIQLGDCPNIVGGTVSAGASCTPANLECEISVDPGCIDPPCVDFDVTGVIQGTGEAQIGFGSTHGSGIGIHGGVTYDFESSCCGNKSDNFGPEGGLIQQVTTAGCNICDATGTYFVEADVDYGNDGLDRPIGTVHWELTVVVT